MGDYGNALRMLFHLAGPEDLEREAFANGSLSPYARQQLLNHYFSSNASDTDTQRPATFEQAVQQGKIDPMKIAALLGIRQPPPFVGS